MPFPFSPRMCCSCDVLCTGFTSMPAWLSSSTWSIVGGKVQTSTTNSNLTIASGIPYPKTSPPVGQSQRLPGYRFRVDTPGVAALKWATSIWPTPPVVRFDAVNSRVDFLSDGVLCERITGVTFPVDVDMWALSGMVGGTIGDKHFRAVSLGHPASGAVVVLVERKLYDARLPHDLRNG